MADIPLDIITIRDCRTGGRAVAQVVELDRDLAQTRIDARWWSDLGIGYRQRAGAEDHHWIWYKIVGAHRNDDFCRCVAIVTPDSEVQGAMIYHLNGRSLLERGKGAVFIDRVATAPRNRASLLNSPNNQGLPNQPAPLYSGVGSGLITLATLHSYQYGHEGRVTLQSLGDADGFYRRQNFTWTGTEVDGMLVYELSSTQARSDLASWGVL